jgi:hypothetical protein
MPRENRYIANRYVCPKEDTCFSAAQCNDPSSTKNIFINTLQKYLCTAPNVDYCPEPVKIEPGTTYQILCRTTYTPPGNEWLVSEWGYIKVLSGENKDAKGWITLTDSLEVKDNS